MYSFTAFPASAVDRDELHALAAEYMALERIRIYRRLLAQRFGILALIVAVVSLGWLSCFAFWFTVSVCLIPPASAWVAELRRERRLMARVRGLSGQRPICWMHSAPTPAGRHLRKS